MSKKLFIFGAGSSVHANGPLNKDWINRIKINEDNIKNNKYAIALLNKLEGFDNVEALLSLIDLSIIEKHNYLPLSGSIEYLKSVRLEILNSIVNVAKEIDVKNRLISDFFKKVELKKGDAVINFNYDLLVDNALFDIGLWNPYKGGENGICGYGFGTTSIGNFDDEEERLKEIAPSEIKYFKLHGSINWKECDKKFVDIDWGMFDPGTISNARTSYKSYENFIITPSFLKMFDLMAARMIWRYSREAINETSEIYIIGYSFPKADEMTRHLLLHASNSVAKIIVIDPLNGDCTEIDKRIDIISMLPWNEDSDFWDNKIIIYPCKLEEYVRRDGLK